MRRTLLASALAFSVVAVVNAQMPVRAAPLGQTAVVPTSGSHERGLSSSRIVDGPRMRDITLRVDPQRRGLGAYSNTWGDTLVFDKNRDGNPDVLLSFHTGPWEIWLGKRRGGFTFDRSLPATDRHHCEAADFAGPHQRRPDGRTDLYCVRGALNGTISDKTNGLLIQRANGGFVNRAASWGVADPSGRGRAVSILDIRGDGRPSLFVGNARPIKYSSKDHIFANMGKRFAERRTGGLPSVQDTRCSSTGDFNRDGRQDFLSCSKPLRVYKNRTTRNGRVSYREVASAEGIPAVRWKDAELIRMNGDRWPDLVTLAEDSLDVRLNTRKSPHFPKVDFSFPLTAGASFCSGRANGDAAADLLVVQAVASPRAAVQERDWMLLNSGAGDRFHALRVPQPPARRHRNGNGDTCSAIPDYRGNRAAWTISNGRQIPRPKQLIPGYRQLVILVR